MDVVVDGRESSAETEARTVALGREIFALARAAPAGESWWDRKVMAMGMADEAVKAQLFRLVDVLPVLTTPESINRHLREYLGEVRGRLPWVARGAMKWLPEEGWFARRLASMTLKNTQRMARRVIAALDAPGAGGAGEKRLGRGWGVYLQPVGEGGVWGAGGVGA